MPTDLTALVAPEHMVLLTQECQQGVIGEGSAWTALAEASRPGGLDAARILEAVKSSGLNADELASQINARIAKRPKQ